MSNSAHEKAQLIRLLILDVDGVLTDGSLYFDSQGEAYKSFNSLDGQGLRMLLDCGLEIAVITGRDSPIVNQRLGALGIDRVYKGYSDKLPAFTDLLHDTGLAPQQFAYVGDDLPDLPVMQRVGLAIAVANAHDFVKQHCDWVTGVRGGHGAAREVTDFLLQAQGLLEAKQNAYLK